MDEGTFLRVLSRSEMIRVNKKVERIRPLSQKYSEKILRGENLVYVVYGLRGTGKTVLLSYLRDKIKDSIYISCDVLVREGVDFLDFLEYAYARGYNTFLLDEIHYVPGWARDAKIFFDETGSKIVVSGSSSIQLDVLGSELSRRAIILEMKPLSFREYIFFKTGILLKEATLNEIIENKKELFNKILPFIYLFDAYVQRDALPACFFENNEYAYQRILEKIVENDLLTIKKLDFSDVLYIYKIIRFVATSDPGSVSFYSISKEIGVNIKFVEEVCFLLQKAGLFYLIPPYGRCSKGVRRKFKILLPLSFRAFLCRHFGVVPSLGGLREDFFVQHVGNCFFGEEKDFYVDDIVFEIGSRKKGCYNVVSDIKEDNDIPIYLFGLLY